MCDAALAAGGSQDEAPTARRYERCTCCRIMRLEEGQVGSPPIRVSGMPAKRTGM
jgi:hypothetical protein